MNEPGIYVVGIYISEQFVTNDKGGKWRVALQNGMQQYLVSMDPDYQPGKLSFGEVVTMSGSVWAVNNRWGINHGKILKEA